MSKVQNLLQCKSNVRAPGPLHQHYCWYAWAKVIVGLKLKNKVINLHDLLIFGKSEKFVWSWFSIFLW